ncbi:tellurite resistance protein TehB [Thalassovita autumnalis]|uniref:Tellurite resistance protein TehB n=1 Tax=Thalassovita autumnalis TaxID=2072972 RepID=A0A0P1FVW6_9RHOB|nr:class I SAM-dependent methyltransferase [Thalassovita autumnalis]CUH69629.1 tellurite resistance protein TehB [Thalassovita autumnalis]CUH73032.1 tellurite resistance protein TehB [Thalassovita autumnalis]
MWEERYAGSADYVFGTAPAQFLRDHLDYLIAGQSALAVADGEGRNSVFMAERGLEVTALEFAPTALDRARSLATEKQVAVDFQHCDILNDPWPKAQYDIVAGIFIQFVGPEGRAVQFERMQAATKPGGVVMLHGYTQKQLDYGTGGPPFLENLYTPEMLRAAFSGWEIVTLEAYEREVQEGRGHSGMSALIDLIARKPEV